MAAPTPLVVINAVGLTSRLLPLAPRLAAATAAFVQPMRGVLGALTLPAQATMLTGLLPREHGVVGNGWYRRELGEVRFWVQSAGQMSGESVYRTAARAAEAQGRPFKSASAFWWFAQGTDADLMLTPKPHYGADGSKAFDVMSNPQGLASQIKSELGPFPFQTFWGPMAGAPASEWIANAAAWLLKHEKPDLLTVYLPHLDYDLQRFGASQAVVSKAVAELDACAKPLLDACAAAGAMILLVSEYGLADVHRPVELNSVLRQAGLLTARDGPFGEMLMPTESDAFAVCDHQIAHVYCRDQEATDAAREVLSGVDGVWQVLARQDQRDVDIDHERSGELVILSERDAWFAYRYWEDDRRAPDFARTVDIHRKPGYDPCELFFDPAIAAPKLRVARRLAARKLGFRNLMDVIPLDTKLVKGSHGLPAEDPLDGPLLACNRPIERLSEPAMTDVKGVMLRLLGLGAAR